MHELSIALSIVDCATEEARRRSAARVHAVHLRLGPLSGVVKDALLFSYQLACAETPLAGSRLEIEDVPVVVYCDNCQDEKTLSSIQHFFCPSCRSATPRVLSGRELEVKALEIDERPREGMEVVA